MAFVLAACSTTAPPSVHSEDRTNFHPTLEQKLEARSEPARIVSEDEAVLSRKGYAKIGMVAAWRQGRNDRAEAAKLLEADVVQKAAESGGDAVRLDRVAVPGTDQLYTGKFIKFCADTTTEQRQILAYGGCGRTVPSYQCFGEYHYETVNVPHCVEWGERKETVDVDGLVSEGTVWRHDPKLSSTIASAHGAKGEATVYVFRKWSILGAAIKNVIYSDNVELARVQNGRYFRVRLEPMRHILRTKAADSDIVIDAKPGGVYYLQANIIFGGFTMLTLTRHPSGITSLKALDLDEVIDPTQVAATGEIPDSPSPNDLGLSAPSWVAGKGLIDVAVEGGLDQAKSLIAAKADVNARDEDGATPLMAASIFGYRGVVQALLEAKADANARNKDGMTPLMYASAGNNLEVAQTLLEAKNNTVDLLTAGSMGDNVQVVRALIDAKAEVNVRNRDGITPLMYASVGGNIEVVRALLEARADVNAKDNDGMTPLMYASMGYNAEVVQALLETKANVMARDKDGNTPLMYASMGVNRLKLHSAAAPARSVKVVRALLDAGADANARNRNDTTPLMYASAGASVEVVRALLEARADVNAGNKNGTDALMFASAGGSVGIVHALLEAKADVNARNRNDTTPLMYASGGGSAEVVRALLEARADVSAKDREGMTPLLFASFGSNVKLVQALLEAKADVNARDNLGITPLMVAAHKGHIKVVQALLEARADVNAHDNLGVTPLMYGAVGASVEAVQALLAAKADVNVRDQRGMTALLLVRKENVEMSNLLKRAGATD